MMTNGKNDANQWKEEKYDIATNNIYKDFNNLQFSSG